MSIKDEIKVRIVQSGWSMSDVVKALNKKQERIDTVQNFSNKLSRETLKYKDAQEIAEVIGYTIVWEPIGK